VFGATINLNPRVNLLELKPKLCEAKKLDKSQKKKRMTAIQLRNNLELENYVLLNEQFHLGLVSYKKNKKLQKQIHDKEGWRSYVC
jgi:hypothetical protein